MPHADPVARREYMRGWDRRKYQKDPEAARAKRKQSYNSDAACKATREWQARNPHKALFNAKRAQAKRHGVLFTLTFDLMSWPEVCPVLGLKLIYERGVRGVSRPFDDSPSFDRVDNSKGYEDGNVIIVSNLANSIKRNATPQQLRQVADFYRDL